MVDILKKASLLTAEIVSIAADKVQEVADEFVKKGTIHDNEAKKFVSEVRNTLESREKELTEKWEQMVTNVNQLTNSLGLAKVDKDNLDGRIDELEKHIDELKARRDMLNKEQKKEKEAAPAASANNAKAAAAKAN